jgi:hypothetical protein
VGALQVHAQIDSHVPRKEPGDWALEISGSIFVTEETALRAGDGSDAEIGIVKAFLIQIREARREGLQASAVLNAKSFATSEYSQLFKKLEWRKRVSRKFEPRSADLLILDRIELKPEYRGQAFGLLAARCVIEMFGSRCGLVACKPFPLQFEGSNRWRPPAADTRTVTRKELDLAQTLIHSLAAGFEPEKYRDTYREKLESIIAGRVAGQPVAVPEKPSGTASVLDITEALQKSLAALKKPVASEEQPSRVAKEYRGSAKKNFSRRRIVVGGQQRGRVRLRTQVFAIVRG